MCQSYRQYLYENPKYDNLTLTKIRTSLFNIRYLFIDAKYFYTLNIRNKMKNKKYHTVWSEQFQNKISKP